MARRPNDILTIFVLQKLSCYLAMPHYLPNHPIQRNTSRLRRTKGDYYLVGPSSPEGSTVGPRVLSHNLA